MNYVQTKKILSYIKNKNILVTKLFQLLIEIR